MKRALLGLALASGLVAPTAVAATIYLGGQDAELVVGVAAELEAAGYDVRMLKDGAQEPAEKLAVVGLWNDGDDVVIKVQLPRAAGIERVGIAEDDSGLSVRDGTALRIAEAVRSLVEKPDQLTPAPPPPMHAHPPFPPYPPYPPYPPPPPPPPPPGWSPFGPPHHAHFGPPPVMSDAAPEYDEPLRVPVLRLGVNAGAQIAAPTAGMQMGATLRGNVSPHWIIGGSLHGVFSLGEHKSGNWSYQTYGMVWQLFVEADLLGSDNDWTPTLGAAWRSELGDWDLTGIITDARGGIGQDVFFVPRGPAVGTGLTGRAGVSFYQPWRLRLDVEAGARLASSAAAEFLGDDDGMPAPAFTFAALIGGEYDLIRADPPLHDRAARRDR